MTIDELNERLEVWQELLEHAREYQVADFEARAKYNINTLLLIGAVRNYIVVETEGILQLALPANMDC